MAGGPSGQELDGDFIESVRPLIQDPFNPFILSSLTDTYGTHYVQTLYTGGIGGWVGIHLARHIALIYG